MAKNIYTYTFGEMNHEGCPYMTVKANSFIIGYIMPFRGYRFQVAGTTNGLGDLGSSPVIHFKEVIKDMDPGDAKNLLIGQAVLALENMCRNAQTYTNISDDMKTSCIVGPRSFNEYITFYNGNDRCTGMNEFIDTCYEWIMK